MRLCVYDIDHKYALQIENTGESDPDTSLIHSFIHLLHYPHGTKGHNPRLIGAMKRCSSLCSSTN